MNRWCRPLALAAFLALSAEAESSGGFAGFVQRMGPGGVPLARGNTGVADPVAAPAAFWNPAAASTLRTHSVAVAGEWRTLERSGGSAGGALPIGNRAMLSYALLWRGAGSIPSIDSDDNTVGSFSPRWTTHYLSMGWRLNRSSGIGVTGQWRSWNSDIDGESWNSPLSLGISWYKEWHPRFSTGAVLRDLGISSGGIARFHQETPGEESTRTSDFYPRTLIVGSRYTTEWLSWPFRLFLDVVDLRLSDAGWAGWKEHELQGRIGAEWEVLGAGRLRAGWDDGNRSLGAGWQFSGEIKGRRVWAVELDYQLLWERNSTFFNPLGLSLLWTF